VIETISSRGLCRIALPPIWASESPTHLDCGRHVRDHLGLVEACDTDKGRPVHNFDCPESPTALRDQSTHPIHRTVALLPRPGATQVTPHFGVSIDRGVRFAIFFAPLTQHHSHRNSILQSSRRSSGVIPEHWPKGSSSLSI
jgi:hypothetical protein